ncbi:MAG TPA: hypothetical protein VH539_19600 [Gemmatimonadaceae bacterium]
MIRTLSPRLVSLALISIFVAAARRTSAQAPALQSPFLFATLAPGLRPVTSMDAGYNERAFEPVGGERLEPRAGALIPFSPLFALRGDVAGASTLDHQTRLAGQMEAVVTPFRRDAISLGASLGMRHEYTGANVGLARFMGARVTTQSALAADVLLEHAYALGRDPVDVVTTIGASRALSSSVWVGVEVVGSDLEGFLDTEEAEGGATVLVGPTLAFAVAQRWRLVLGGGPVLRASSNATPTGAPSPASPLGTQRSGYVLRSSLRLAW